MTAEETVRRMAERAMGSHRLNPHDLAKAVGCGDTTVSHLLNEDTVRLTTEQWLNLSALGGWFDKEGKHDP